MMEHSSEALLRYLTIHDVLSTSEYNNEWSIIGEQQRVRHVSYTYYSHELTCVEQQNRKYETERKRETKYEEKER
jgi:hypothetical protein